MYTFKQRRMKKGKSHINLLYEMQCNLAIAYNQAISFLHTDRDLLLTVDIILIQLE